MFVKLFLVINLRAKLLDLISYKFDLLQNFHILMHFYITFLLAETDSYQRHL